MNLKSIFHVKLLKCLFILSTLLLVGCDGLKTVEGHWKSSKSENGEFYAAVFYNDQFTFYSMVTDSTYSERIDGLWFSRGDTLTLYSQDKGTKNFILKHLSGNTMAIEDGKDRLVMSRIYLSENIKNKYIGTLLLFIEEAYHQGFWGWMYCIVCCTLIVYLINMIIKWLVDKMKIVIKALSEKQSK